MEDSERQSDEIFALESIYEDLLKTDSNTSGDFTAKVQLPEGGVQLEGGHVVEYLPPINVHFELPSDYPSANPPQFSLKCDWLTYEQLTNIRDELLALWSPGNEVLFDVFDHLCNRAISFSDKLPAEKITSIIQDLLTYNQKEVKQAFAQSVHTCPICFMERLGSSCECLQPCDHVTCHECLSSYLNFHISEGSVDDIHCPHDGCDSTVYPHQIQALVSEEMFARYERLTLQRSLDSMQDVTQCPRKSCACPVLLDTDAHMGRCPKCSIVFCSFCRLTYHGVEPCKLAAGDIQKLLEEYRNEGPNSEFMQNMKKRYGAKTIDRLIQEAESMDWVKENSVPCPHCKAPIQKFDGCNKVVCTKCGTPMCWLCGLKLDLRTPYQHFNEIGSPCFNRLFAGIV